MLLLWLPRVTHVDTSFLVPHSDIVQESGFIEIHEGAYVGRDATGMGQLHVTRPRDRQVCVRVHFCVSLTVVLHLFAVLLSRKDSFINISHSLYRTATALQLHTRTHAHAHTSLPLQTHNQASVTIKAWHKHLCYYNNKHSLATEQ